MGDVSAQFLCFVCGYSDLVDPPWDNDAPSDEICPSCGIHFGYDDAAGGDPGLRESIYREWRRRWIAAGMRWWSLSDAPVGWDPEAQLRSVTG
jgi:hypothetical protein